MKSFALMFCVLAMSSLAQAKDVMVNMAGKDVAVQYRVLNREITEKDRNTGSQGSAQECSLLYYSLLAKGDIQGAAQLAVDPAAAAGVWQQYRDRLGGDDFRKEMAAYFAVKNVFVAELELAGETMLLIRTPDYTAGQFYRNQGGKYFVVSGRPSSEASKTLGKALNLIKEGKLKLE